MRPTCLIMSGFGPYAEETKIDFESLGTNGIYLICGDTGAGKSTIFDAISYALYGEPSQSRRTGAMMRSQYAAPETRTFVELSFVVGSRRAVVRRSPEYERPKARGEGMTTQHAEASLTLYDDMGEVQKVLTKPKEVDAYIEGELLGIDRNQFSQIAMIAQGDFERLLLSGTQDKQRIFRKLFRTGDYELLENALKEEVRVLSKERDDMIRSVRIHLQGISASEEAPFAEELQTLQAAQEAPAERLEALLAAVLSADEQEVRRLQDQAREREKALEAAQMALARAREREEKKKQLAGYRQQEEVLRKRAEEAEDERRKAVKAAEACDSLKEQEGAVDALLPLFERLEEQRGKRDETQGQLRKSRESLAGARRALAGLAAEKEAAGRELERLSHAEKDLQEVQVLLQGALHLAEKEQRARKSLSEVFAADKKREQAQCAYVEAAARSERGRADYEALHRAYLDAQAGILARDLIEGTPCPVCGSPHHPAPALLPEGRIPSREELEKAGEAAEALRRAEQRASEEAAGALASHTHLLEAAAQALAEAGIPEDPVSAKEAVSARIREREGEIAALSERKAQAEKDAARRTALLQEGEKRDALLEKAGAEAAALGERVAQLEQRLSQEEEELAKQQKGLPWPSREEALARREALSAQRGRLLKEREEKEKGAVALKEQLISLRAGIGELEAALEGEETDLEAALLEKEEREKRRDEVRRLLETALARTSNNTANAGAIRQLGGKLASKEEEFRRKKSLSDTMNGNVTGKEKVALETYVQATFFDRIIERANLRFMVMSGGQYELRRVLEAQEKVSKTGLEMEVIDHYNGSRRSVKSLSGGETFLASLSLALGLSDEIEESAGGIRLDTLFVDEGFGSLDSDSLAQVMEALTLLTEGRRLVGIISHVEELRERIDAQIRVTKRKEGGSSVRMVL